MTVSFRLAVLVMMAAAIVAGAAGPKSALFAPEGHGKRGYYYFPDDQTRRITALDDVVTPHIAWARPMAGGPVRVLAIAHKSMGRWPIELKQRFDIELTTIYGHDHTHLGTHGGGFAIGLFVQGHADVEARLLQAMNEPIDVIINDISLEAWGDRCRQRLAELLTTGVGYVGYTDGLDLTGCATCQPEQKALLSAALPIKALRAVCREYETPEAASGKLLKLWKNATGARIADLTAYPHDNKIFDVNRLQYLNQIDMEWEGWSSLAGRALLWAAGRVPAGGVVKVAWPDEEIEQATMPCRLSVKTLAGVKLRVRVWDLDGRLRFESDKAVIPHLPAERYVVGIEGMKDGAMVDWALGTVDVKGDTEIASIELDSEYKKLAEEIVATITLSGPAAGSTVRVQALDNFGRVVDQKNLSASATLTATLDPTQSLHIYNYVNVQLLDGKGIMLDEDRHAFYIDQPGPEADDLNWFVWEGGCGFHPRSRNLCKQFVRLGATGFLGASEFAAMVNAHPVQWVFRLPHVRVDDEGMDHPDLTSAGFVNSSITQAGEQARKYEPMSPLFHYLGDDVSYTSYGQDGGWSASFRARLNVWLQEQYASLDELNDAWQTSYASWNEVEPIKRTEALAAFGQGKPGPLCHWIDVQLFEDFMFADFYRILREGLREVAPETPANMGCSVVGWTWPGSGIDFWQLAEDKKLVFQYPNPWVHDIFRCAAAKDAYHGVWYGGYGLYNYDPYRDHEYMPWWSVFRGVNLHGQYYGGQSSTWNSERLLGADLGPVSGFAKIVENFQELQGGTAKLLFNARRCNDGIALVHSTANLHTSVIFNEDLPRAAEWEGGSTASSQFIYMQGWEGMSYLIRDMGFSHDVIPASHLTADTTWTDDYRVLLLPLSVRLTEKETAALTQFVKNGGVVIADVFPGMFDGQCRPRQDETINELFGVTFAGDLSADRVVCQDVATGAGQELGLWAVDTGVRLTSAQAGAQAAETPVLVANQYGAGQAILLNVLVRDYQIYRTLGTEIPFRDTIAHLLAQAELKPRINCQVKRGKTMHRIQTTEFNCYEMGGAEYVGVLRHHKLRPDDPIYMADQRPKPCWMSFDRKTHVYDIRHHMYRGFVDKVEDVIYPGRAELYALMPYEIRGLELSAQRDGRSVRVAGEIMTGDEAPANSTHVFHVELFDPSGKRRREYTANLVGENGRFASDFYLGYETVQGRWQVTVREVVSGIERSVKVAF